MLWTGYYKNRGACTSSIQKDLCRLLPHMQIARCATSHVRLIVPSLLLRRAAAFAKLRPSTVNPTEGLQHGRSKYLSRYSGTMSTKIAPHANESESDSNGRCRQQNRLILCFDGTGNSFQGTSSDTNIVKLVDMLSRRDDHQYHYYQRKLGQYAQTLLLIAISWHRHIHSRWIRKPPFVRKNQAMGLSDDRRSHRYQLRFTRDVRLSFHHGSLLQRRSHLHLWLLPRRIHGTIPRSDDLPRWPALHGQ